MLNLLLLASVSFLPLPTRLLAEHIGDADASTAVGAGAGRCGQRCGTARGGWSR